VRKATTMTAGARRVAAGFAATGGVARGADLIEQRLLRAGALTAECAGADVRLRGVGRSSQTSWAPG
jgi:hypothetical protein